MTLLADGGCRVVDNGRGIPIDVHPEYKMSGVEIVLTKLHGGGKFGGDGYKVSGGLHGVGVSVVNALSTRLVVEVDRDGKRHRMEFADGGKPNGPSSRSSATSPRGRTGTTVTFWPDRTVFETTEFRARTMLERLQMMAFLNKGLEIRFRDERPDHDAEPVVYQYAGGIIDFVRHLNASQGAAVPQGRLLRAGRGRPGGRGRVPVEHRLPRRRPPLASPTASPPSRAACTRRASEAALTNVVNKYARAKGLLKEKDENLLGEDIREGLTAIISVRLRDPQFEGQTKAKLGNTSIRSLVERATNEKLGDWLEEHPTEANKIVQEGDRRRRGPAWPPRRRATLTRRKSALDGAGMPDKLDGLLVREPRRVRAVHRRGRLRRRLGHQGAATRAPRRSCPIRGKILNVERARIDKMLKNNEIQALISAIGAGVGDEFDVDEDPLRQGHHPGRRRRRRQPHPHAAAHVLLPPDEAAGRARPRLHRPAAAVLHRWSARRRCTSRTTPPRRAFLAEQPEPQEGVPAPQGPRRDGLATSSARPPWTPATRTLLQVDGRAGRASPTRSSRILMGDDVERRKHFIQTNAKDVRFLDI